MLKESVLPAALALLTAKLLSITKNVFSVVSASTIKATIIIIWAKKGNPIHSLSRVRLISMKSPSIDPNIGMGRSFSIWQQRNSKAKANRSSPNPKITSKNLSILNDIPSSNEISHQDWSSTRSKLDRPNSIRPNKCKEKPKKPTATFESNNIHRTARICRNWKEKKFQPRRFKLQENHF